MPVSSHVSGFPPLISRHARVLVLGTMPGVASLREQQYYAHPRNAFWPIAAQLYGFGAQASYQVRCEALKANGIALWDVLQACERPGSLDANILAASVVPNDFEMLFRLHPGIERVCFNGAKAAALYKRHVLPALGLSRELLYFELPSTSPAHAAMSLQDKSTAWRRALDMPVP
ncbi:DNA-deoxyinosine glycosylase [Bordetella muralis]|uniref:DNA-deoxyinosine glycosylase n=1 Tax=Bordetella muralis TaxID=1649130 RepID=UPI0039F03E3E